jgi:hypothetical protein
MTLGEEAGREKGSIAARAVGVDSTGKTVGLKSASGIDEHAVPTVPAAPGFREAGLTATR